MRARPFGAVLARDLIGQIVQLCAPFCVGFHNLIHCILL
jgi:hypothetical protein